MCALFRSDRRTCSSSKTLDETTPPVRRNSLRRLFRKLRSHHSDASRSLEREDTVRIMGPRDTIVTSIESGDADSSPRMRRAAARRSGYRASM